MSSEHAFQLDAALRIRLLLVDDEPDFKEVMLKHLSRKGIRLSVAECCLDALDLPLSPPNALPLLCSFRPSASVATDAVRRGHSHPLAPSPHP